jgi:precorrin-3B methylase
MLYIVGLGLGDERDITVRGLDAVRSCSKIYMEAYTSLLSLGLDPAALANLVRLPSLVRPSPVRANTHVARSEFHWRSRFLLCASRRSCTGRR